ncbi:hypothetical protein ABZ656_04260 [Streptomyces sp. NPDC007095]|uniref:hypothetical protein n=1 Tax=Streptomyces sp. NPDC007095 TaxID=3154482 RepID=UPI0033FBA70D
MTDLDIPEPLRQLLAAIDETLTLPDPAGDRDDLVRYEMCVSDRIHLVQLAVRDLLAGKSANGVQWEADYLRKKSADNPPRYRNSEQYIADLRKAVANLRTVTDEEVGR